MVNSRSDGWHDVVVLMPEQFNDALEAVLAVREQRTVVLNLSRLTPELAQRHYEEHVEKPFYPLLEEFITAAPVVALAVDGPEAIGVMRSMLGSTNGREAAPGTIRGDFGVSRQMNLMHGSDSAEAAANV